MRSIERRFREQEARNPTSSTLINFSRAIRSQQFTRHMIGRWFHKLVDPEDYSGSRVREILHHLNSLSMIEDDSKRVKSVFEAGSKLEDENYSDLPLNSSLGGQHGAFRGV